MIAAATRAAIVALRREHPQDYYAFALLTSGEALAPYLSACSLEADLDDGLERWSFADSPYVVWGYDEHFSDVVRAFHERGELVEHEHPEVEYAVRLASIEEGLRLLDVAGLFGSPGARQEVLLIAGTMPPDESDAGFVRRLNPPGQLFDEWLRECSEQRQPIPDGPPATPTSPAPNTAVAELWRTTPGLRLPSGITVYGPDELAEQNAAHGIAERAPTWALVGEVADGRGLLMRSTGPAFDPARARESAEVFEQDLDALAPDVPEVGTFVTDDLVGWLGEEQR